MKCILSIYVVLSMIFSICFFASEKRQGIIGGFLLLSATVLILIFYKDSLIKEFLIGGFLGIIISKTLVIRRIIRRNREAKNHPRKGD